MQDLAASRRARSAGLSMRASSPPGSGAWKPKVAAVLLAPLLALPAAALELRVHPAPPVYLVDVDARHGVRSAMLQNLAVLNPDGEVVTLDRIRVEVRAGERVRQAHSFDAPDLDAAGARMAKLGEMGVLKLYDFAFQTSRYLPAGTVLAASRALPARSALVLNGIPLLIRGAADSIRVVAEGKGRDGNPAQAALDVPLGLYAQKNAYRFPLEGAWLVAVGPAFSEPHRWAPNEEFGLDVVRVGASGRTCGGPCSRPSDYYGYGQPVVAVADGEVVSVESGQGEALHRFRRPGESGEAFLERTIREQAVLLGRGAAGVGGNFVVVRHGGGEYSHYAHLAAGSVRVKPGEKVVRGQALAKLGHTGNSTEPHLHFTVADGPDPLYARSLPVRVEGLTTADGPQEPVYPQSGWLVETTPLPGAER